MNSTLRSTAPVLLTAGMLWGVSRAQELTVVNVHPPTNGTRASIDTQIRVDFDRPVDPATVTNGTFSAFGRWSGDAGGTFRFENGNRTVVMILDQSFSAGELVTVSMSDSLLAADASPFRSAGYSHQFWTAARPADQLVFEQIDSMTTNALGSSRPYGGVATDLNNDGWLDITVVNEDTADLGVFLNQGTGSGSFDPFLQPTFAVGNRASPSEAHDFNRDGNADLAVANINDNTLSVLLGNGDGTFAPQQLRSVGNAPRGIAALDVDGDADMDIVNTNFGSSSLSLLINNGGVFADPAFLEAGVDGEFSLMAGDMNNDGISDLVVGGANSQTLRVLLGDGDGSFSRQAAQSAGGQTWQIMLGDVNGDGNLDVSTVNGRSDNGAILLGNGDGTLQQPDIYDLKNIGPSRGNSWPLATDLGDLDGDGDLDWVTSSFAGGSGNGDWLVLLNDGSGTFTFFEEIDSPSAASCSLLHDFDNDGDLDLGLIDEIADRLVLVKNSGIHNTEVSGDFDHDHLLTIMDLDALADEIRGDTQNLGFDLSADGVVDHADLRVWIEDLRHTWFGDANLDGEFNSTDLVMVFQAGQYEDDVAGNSTWATGDSNADGEFDSSDLVAAFRAGGYEQGRRGDANGVPEPTSLLTLIAGLIGMATLTRANRNGLRRRDSRSARLPVYAGGSRHPLEQQASPRYAITSWITLPCTSVSRRSRPL